MLKPIETRYAGCRFRSRLEARWAVFFDHLSVKWEYEPEGYETPDGRYLTDFLIRLHNRMIHLEIKPEIQQPIPWPHFGSPSNSSLDPRWHHVAHMHGGFYVAYGLPNLDRSQFSEDGFPSSFQPGLIRIWPNGEGESKYFFCQCPYCAAISIKNNGRMIEETPHPLDEDKDVWQTSGIAWDRRITKFPCCGTEWNYPTPLYSGGTSSIISAYAAARSARFEHGEQG